MATTQIHGSRQIKSDTILDAQINSAAAISTSKLADAANFILRGGSVAFTADQSMGGNKLTNLATPSTGTDAANKNYVDAVQSGLDVKQSVRVATTTNGTLATAFANGQTVDGITLVTGNRILLKNQTTGSENGIYTVNASGAPTRATDADSDPEVTAGLFTFVSEGTINANTGWVLATVDPIVVDTTALVFTQFSSQTAITAGAGLLQTGSTFDVVSANGGIVVNADNIALTLNGTNLSVGAGGLKIADGTAGQLLIAGAGGVFAATTMSGDGTISSSGVLTLAATVVFNADVVTNETPSGTINGSNVTFTLANTPIAGTVALTLNGLMQESGAGNDYTISGATVTYLTAPISGDKLRASYIK